MPTDEEVKKIVESIAASNLDSGTKEVLVKRMKADAEVIGVKRSDLRQAFPTMIATFGAALLGASAEKGSVLRYAGALPGLIDLFDKAQAKRDAGELIIPLATAAAGGAAPALIK